MKTKATSRALSFLLAGTLALAVTAPVITLAAEPAKPKIITTVTSQVNINTADAQTMADLLVGVGMSKARAIVKYREEHGRFTSIDQLKDVKGIGQALINTNKERLAVE